MSGHVDQVCTGNTIDGLQGPRWELYSHGADVGIRGFGRGADEAFEGIALALTAAVSDLSTVFPNHRVDIHCDALDAESLLYEWVNAVIYQMATRQMLFSRYRVNIVGTHLGAEAWGEPLDPERHQPATEVKGATYTDLGVAEIAPNLWRAQCIIDV
jgi:SHS2 domain-containing protein